MFRDRLNAFFRFSADFTLRILNNVRALLPSIYFWVGLFLFLLAIGISIGGHYCQYGKIDFSALWKEFYANIGSELAGIAITILFIDSIGRRRAIQQQKRALVLQMGSLSNDLAREAVRVLRIEGWITQGVLKGAKLEGADLRGVNLESASMQAANLDRAVLTEANLYCANLERVSFTKATLRNADLPLANLEGANLRKADLEGAVLDGAVLFGADLVGANLVGSTLDKARLNENTTLPDGVKWSAYQDVARFTRPSHEQFWRSTDSDSPAYPH